MEKFLENSSKIISNTLLSFAISPEIFNNLIGKVSFFHLLLIKQSETIKKYLINIKY